MGMDYKCGCRWSMGKWFLCDKHEGQLEDTLILEAERGDSNGKGKKKGTD